MGTMPQPFRDLAKEIRKNKDRWLGGNQQALAILNNDVLLKRDFWNRFIQAHMKHLNVDMETYLRVNYLEHVADSLVFHLMLVEKQPGPETTITLNLASWGKEITTSWPNSQDGRIARYRAYSELASELARIIKEDGILNMMILKKDGLNEYWFEVAEVMAAHIRDPGFGTVLPVGSDIPIPKGKNAKRYRAETELIRYFSDEVGSPCFDLISDAMFALLGISETPEAIADRCKKRKRKIAEGSFNVQN